LEIALNAGLSICEELMESERDAVELRWVMMDSLGSTADLFLHRLLIDPSLLLRRFGLAGATVGACSMDRRRLENRKPEELEDQASVSPNDHSGCTGELGGEG
jgi:hypothetical protein